MVGIKGSGMSSLAVFLHTHGINICGWDVAEEFITDRVLTDHSIPFSYLSPTDEQLSTLDFLIYSSAYSIHHPIIDEAKKYNITILSYYEALAHLSKHYPTFGVSGTHGKTTSVAAIHHMLSSNNIPHSVICGAHLDKKDSLKKEIKHVQPLIVEACEYQDHFLSLSLNGLFITNVEYEHVDYFKDEKALFESFFTLIQNLPKDAPIICNRDEKGMDIIINYVEQHRKDLNLITYGKGERNTYSYCYPHFQNIHSLYVKELDASYTTFLVGEAFISDLFGSALLAMMIPSTNKKDSVLDFFLSTLHNFSGAKGRVQRLTHVHHMFHLYNDYAHHPSEIRASFHSLRLLHPNNKLILIFFPHTVSRMKAFFDDFVSALSLFDEVYILPVALCARGDGSIEEAVSLSKQLAHECNGTFVYDEHSAMNILLTVLHSQDVCITMGAGNTMGMKDQLLTLKELPL